MDAGAERLFAHATAGDPAALEQMLERDLPQLHAYVHARLGTQPLPAR